MLTQISGYDIHLILRELDAHVRHCCGYDNLACLAGNPNSLIHCTRLRNLNHYVPEQAEEFTGGEELFPDYIQTGRSLPELPIPFADFKAIMQIRRDYLKLLRAEKAAAADNDYAKADDIREERERIEDYLRQAISRKGHIRYLQNRTHDDYRIVRANLLHLLKKVRAYKPEYADYIEQHLVIGFYLMWRE